MYIPHSKEPAQSLRLAILWLAAAGMATSTLSYASAAELSGCTFFNIFLLALAACLILTPIAESLIGNPSKLFDLKHPFLAYYFVALVFNSFVIIVYNPNGGIPAPDRDPTTTLKSVSLITLAISSFLVGNYAFYIRVPAALPRKISPFNNARLYTVGLIGSFAGIGAVIHLLHKHGGFLAFMSNLGVWRTLGILEGTGHITFLISAVSPACALAIVSYTFARSRGKFRAPQMLSSCLFATATAPLLLLGFRASIVPLLFSFLAIWHLALRPIRVPHLAIAASCIVCLLAIYGSVRAEIEGHIDPEAANSILFRVAGLHTVERVILGTDQGQPNRAPGAVLLEATTILFPRALWPSKPTPGSLVFAENFLYDYFILRGDSPGSVMSGLPPTWPGELFWAGGLLTLVAGSVSLGLYARVAFAMVATCRRDSVVFIYSLLFGLFPLFVEAPQNTLNAHVLWTVLITVLLLLTTRPVRKV